MAMTFRGDGSVFAFFRARSSMGSTVLTTLEFLECNNGSEIPYRFSEKLTWIELENVHTLPRNGHVILFLVNYEQMQHPSCR